MLAYIYTFSFAASLGGLIAWFYYKDQPAMSRWMSRIFVGGFFTYLFALAFADGAFSAKLFILFRDFMVLSVVALFFNVVQKYLYVFIAGLVLLYGSFRMGYQQVMMDSFKALTTSEQKADVQENFQSPTLENIQGNRSLAKDGELLIELKEGKTINDIKQEFFMRKFNLNGLRIAFDPEDEDATILDNFVIADATNDIELNNIIRFLDKATDLVQYYEFNESIQIDDPVASDSELDIERGEFLVNDPGLSQSWSFKKLDVNQLHLDLKNKKIKPGKKALIAILDTGVDKNHEDLSAKYKSVANKNDKDAVGHGTHCAGIAAAVSNNGKGIASYAFNNDFVEVTSIKVLNDFGGGTQNGIINGMIKAADEGADVISMSLGGRSSAAKQRAYNKAVEYANKKGAIVVVAAGNSNMDAKNYAPANAKGVISVSAINQNIERAPFSNTVNNVGMGIAAPGVNIYSTTPGNKYASFNGTSMAAPHVAGLVGLMKSIYPDIDTESAYHILSKTGIETKDTPKTGKLIQPAAAIDYLTKSD
ncbi:MAG: S8 family serine peptidase [Bacteroidia bacterium]|nr:S8 family serine peptidase [Bacteroidia bacterium]